MQRAILLNCALLLLFVLSDYLTWTIVGQDLDGLTRSPGKLTISASHADYLFILRIFRLDATQYFGVQQPIYQQSSRVNAPLILFIVAIALNLSLIWRMGKEAKALAPGIQPLHVPPLKKGEHKGADAERNILNSIKSAAEKLRTLESEKKNILLEVEELKKLAESKTKTLQSEVNTLKEEVQSMRTLLGAEETAPAKTKSQKTPSK